MNKIELRTFRSLVEENGALRSRAASVERVAYEAGQAQARLVEQMKAGDEALARLESRLQDEQANVARCARELNQAEEALIIPTAGRKAALDRVGELEAARSRAEYAAPDADVDAIRVEWVADLTQQLLRCEAMISYNLPCGLPRNHDGPHMGLTSA